jgi:glycine/D-amino acid oxidase-like deaminating enzyme
MFDDAHLTVRKAAVLGAGVMGAQIAAHLVNASVEVILFELAAKEGPASGNVFKAIENLKKIEPAPLSSAFKAAYIDTGNYDQDLEKLRECDLVVEGDRGASGSEEGALRQGRAIPFGRRGVREQTPRVCPSSLLRKRCPKRGGRGSAACTSSTRHAT